MCSVCLCSFVLTTATWRGQGEASKTMPAASGQADPLHVPVPDEAIDALRAEVAAELESVAGRELLQALGGDPHCFRRVLIARKLKVDAAATMLRATLKFRNELGQIIPIDVNIRDKVEPYWPCSFCARSGHGRSVMLVRLGSVEPKKVMNEITEAEFRSYYIHWMELEMRHQASTGNENQVEVYDLSGLSFSQLHMPGLRMMARVLSIGQDHYPESLHRCVIINAPRFFSIAWSVVSMVLEERVRQKTMIISGDGRAVLREVLDFDDTQVDELLATETVTCTTAEKEGHRWLKALPPEWAPPKDEMLEVS